MPHERHLTQKARLCADVALALAAQQRDPKDTRASSRPANVSSGWKWRGVARRRPHPGQVVVDLGSGSGCSPARLPGPSRRAARPTPSTSILQLLKIVETLGQAVRAEESHHRARRGGRSEAAAGLDRRSSSATRSITCRTNRPTRALLSGTSSRRPRRRDRFHERLARWPRGDALHARRSGSAG